MDLMLEMCLSKKNYKDSHFDITAASMLEKYHCLVISEAKRFNIDGRAIAGAITWEYEQNLVGRLSDYDQLCNSFLGENLTGSPKLLGGIGKGVGWGSIHTKILEELYFQGDLDSIRMNAISAISAVAHIMAYYANLFYEASSGIWINDNPFVLAYFFNTGKKQINKVAQ